MRHDTAYPSDLTDQQWAQIQPLLPAAKRGGRPPKHSRREILNAILYITHAGCPWRYLPHCFPAWGTVYGYFRRWNQLGIWTKIHDRLRSLLRVQSGKNAEPSAGIIDSQSVKTSNPQGCFGYDAGKKVVGRKRHLVVDTLGLMLGVLVTPANEQDRDMACPIFARVLNCFRTLKVIWADSGYSGKLLDWVAGRWRGRARVEIIKRNQASKGFQVQRRRWVVERTFGWLTKARRLVKDYERKTEHSEAFIYIRMSHLMLRRLHRST